MDNKKSLALREGVLVLIALAVLTVIEYVLGVDTGTGFLLLISLVKAALVITYFMHIRRVFSVEEGGR